MFREIIYAWPLNPADGSLTNEAVWATLTIWHPDDNPLNVVYGEGGLTNTLVTNHFALIARNGEGVITTTGPAAGIRFDPLVDEWPPPATANFSESLPPIAGGSSDVPGTFEWAHPNPGLPAGDHDVWMRFVPANTAHFLTVSNEVRVTVLKSHPQVEAWPTNYSMTYGQAFTNDHLVGGSAKNAAGEPVSGAFRFDIADGTYTNAGEWTLDVTFWPEQVENYLPTDGGTIVVTVNPASLTITASNNNKVYGQTVAGGDGYTQFTVGDDQLQFDETVTSVTVAYTNGGAEATASVGSYAGTISLSEAVGDGGFDRDNYTITYVSGMLTVNKRAVWLPNITAAHKEYDGTITATITSYGPFDNIMAWDIDNLSVTPAESKNATATFDSADVGTDKTVTITGLGLSGMASENYEIGTHYATADITQYNLTITADARDKLYGDVLSGGTGYTNFSYIPGTLPNEETVTSVTVAYTNGGNLATSAVGEYADTISLSEAVGDGGFDRDNYAITYVSSNLTVNKRAVWLPNITAAHKEYDGTITATVTSYGPFDNIMAWDIDNLSVTPTESKNATATFDSADVGMDKTVTITGLGLSGTASDNYEIGTRYATADIWILLFGADAGYLYHDAEPSEDKGTTFDVETGFHAESQLAITNIFDKEMWLVSVIPGGPAPEVFEVIGMPTRVAAHSVSNFTVRFSPVAGMVYNAWFHIIACKGSPGSSGYYLIHHRLRLEGTGVWRTESGIPFAWLQMHGLPTDGSVDHIDLDGDGHTVWQEWRAGTDPNDAGSVLRLKGVERLQDQTGYRIWWHSVTNRWYKIQRSTNLMSLPLFEDLKDGIPGQPESTSHTDRTAPTNFPAFYRVIVEPFQTSTIPTNRIINLSGYLAFGDLIIGTTATRTLMIHNDGNSTLTVSGISYPDGFSGDWEGGTIAAGGSQNVTVTFTPMMEHGYGGEIAVESDATDGHNIIGCSGMGLLESGLPNEMVLIPGGTNSGTDPDFGAYSLTVDSFYMGKHLVTKALWDEVRTHPDTVARGYEMRVGGGQGVNHPVHTVSWFDAIKWLNAWSELMDREPVYYKDAAMTQVYRTGEDVSEPYVKASAGGFRLPTMVEWEYAARGGLQGKRFPWGDEINHDHANYRANGSAFDYDTSPYTTGTYHPKGLETGSMPYTTPVDYFAPNDYGLYDMAGNLLEWNYDWLPSNVGSYRVLRGGGWGSFAGACWSASRFYHHPSFASFASGYGFGFRVALAPGQQ